MSDAPLGQEGPDEDFTPQRMAHFFDPWLATSHPLLRAISTNVAGSIAWAETRQRGMKERDFENLQALVQTIVANLAFSIARGDDPAGVAVSMRGAKKKFTRYDRKGFFSLPRTLEALDKTTVLRLHKSKQKGISSTITPGWSLLEIEEKLRPRLNNFFQQPGAELIVLSRTNADYTLDTKSYEFIDYTDTEETRRLRSEVERINAFLAQANLTLDGDAAKNVALRRRELRRFFKLPKGEETPRFDLGGRLFGAWWQDLPRTERHAIRINGMRIADLDFSNMFVRLAYLETGEKPPAGDLYGMVLGPSHPGWREVVKRTFSAMLFRTGPLTRLPKDMPTEIVPTGITGKIVRQAILSAHPALAPILETGVGLRLMFKESQILMEAVLRLTDLGAVSLPMHDGLMVSGQDAWQAETIMVDAAKEVAGFPLPVVRKAVG